MSTATRFAEESAHYLVDVHLARLGRALERLPDEDLFWRPNPGSLSFGTILLHLDGNVRQWILSGIGGQEDLRERDAEFAAEKGPSGGGRELFERLTNTVVEAAEMIRTLSADALLGRAVFQGVEQERLGAVYHVVEHFAYHTGQAVWIAKARG